VADIELVFNEGESLPNATAASDTLVEAVNSGNFSLPVDASTIVARGKAVVFIPSNAKD